MTASRGAVKSALTIREAQAWTYYRLEDAATLMYGRWLWQGSIMDAAVFYRPEKCAVNCWMRWLSGIV